MTTISKKQLTSGQRKNLQELLDRLFEGSKAYKEYTKLLSELLSPTEHEALLRRSTAVFLLDRGVSYYAINKSLGISVYTLRQFDKKMKSGELDTTLKRLRTVMKYSPENIDRTRAGHAKYSNIKIKEKLRGDITGFLPYYGESRSHYQRRMTERA